MINKKSQSGQIFASLPALLLVLFILAGYLAMTAGIALVVPRPEPKKTSILPISENNLLLQTLNFNFQQERNTEEVKSERGLLVLDAFVLYENQGSKQSFSTRANFEDKLRKLFDETNKKRCIILIKEIDPKSIISGEDNKLNDDFYLCINNKGEYVSDIYHKDYFGNINKGLKGTFIDELVKKYRDFSLLSTYSFVNNKGQKVNVEFGYGDYYENL